MNCSPNDLAEIVRACPRAQNLIGTRIVVTTCRSWMGGAAWNFATFDGRPLRDRDGNEVTLAEDAFLRPIRGPELHALSIEARRVPAKPKVEVEPCA